MPPLTPKKRFIKLVDSDQESESVCVTEYLIHIFFSHIY